MLFPWRYNEQRRLEKESATAQRLLESPNQLSVPRVTTLDR